MGVLEDIWIIQNGVVLFSRNYQGSINDQMFGAYLYALDLFSSKIATKGVQEFELKNNKFLLKRHKEILFIVNAPSTIKQKKIKKELDNLADMFLTEYTPEFFQNWDGNIDIFESFNQKLDDSISKKIQSFESGIW